MPQELPIPDRQRACFEKLAERKVFPSNVLTMETDRSWRDGEVLSKDSRVGKIQWIVQAAGRCRCYICMLTICRESDQPVFAQYQIIPFALFGLCVMFFYFKNHKLYHPT